MMVWSCHRHLSHQPRPVWRKGVLSAQIRPEAYQGDQEDGEAEGQADEKELEAMRIVGFINLGRCIGVLLDDVSPGVVNSLLAFGDGGGGRWRDNGLPVAGLGLVKAGHAWIVAWAGRVGAAVV